MLKALFATVLLGCGASTTATPQTTPPPPPPVAAPAPVAPAPAATADATCRPVIAAFMDRMIRLEEKGAPQSAESEQMIHDMVAKMIEPMVGACTDDAWSQAILHCLDGSKTDSDADKCESLMTDAQKDDVQRRVTAAMSANPAPPAGAK